MLKFLFVLLSICYPFVVFYGLSHYDHMIVALIVVSVLVLRAFLSRERNDVIIAIVASVLIFGFGLFDSNVGVKLYPVMISVLLLVTFAASLWQPQTVIERFARMKHPELPAAAVGYLRKLTLVWCVFFVLNGAVAFYTAIWGSDQLWALYNGLISYIVIGALMSVEFIYRKIFVRY